MEAKELKKKLHALIENSPEDTLEYMYSLFEENEYPGDLKESLDKEYSEYQAYKEGFERSEVDKLVNDLLAK